MRSFNPLAPLFAAVAASLVAGRNMFIRGESAVCPLPEAPRPQRKHGGGRGGKGNTLPRKKRQYCFAQEVPVGHRHGAQRRRHAFEHGVAYEARSRHVGNQMFSELEYAAAFGSEVGTNG